MICVLCERLWRRIVMLASLFLKLFLLGIAAQLVTCMYGGGLCLIHVPRIDFSVTLKIC